MEQEKKKETLKEKFIRIRNLVRKPILFVLALIPLFGMIMHFYSLGFPMLNMWDLLVEYMFGSFWVAVGFLLLTFFLILMLGGISYYTILIFLMYFLLAMSIGYSYALIAVAIFVFGLVYVIYQVFKLMENR